MMAEYLCIECGTELRYQEPHYLPTYIEPCQKCTAALAASRKEVARLRGVLREIHGMIERPAALAPQDAAQQDGSAPVAKPREGE